MTPSPEPCYIVCANNVLYGRAMIHAVSAQPPESSVTSPGQSISPVFNWHLLPSVSEKDMATHSSILAWEIPRTEELDGLQSMGVTKESDMT